MTTLGKVGGVPGRRGCAAPGDPPRASCGKPRGEVTPGKGGRCWALRKALRCAGEGPGRRLEGVQPGALPVRAERGGQGPEAEKEMLSKAGDRRPVGTHKRKELGILGIGASRNRNWRRRRPRMLGAPPSGGLPLRNEGNEGSGWFGVWGGREGRGLSEAGDTSPGGEGGS